MKFRIVGLIFKSNLFRNSHASILKTSCLNAESRYCLFTQNKLLLFMKHKFSSIQANKNSFFNQDLMRKQAATVNTTAPAMYNLY